MFGDRKAKGEDGFDEHETPFEVDKEKQEIVVKEKRSQNISTLTFMLDFAVR